jgi:formylglycine-generating enzyme required for sulfatase activity
VQGGTYLRNYSLDGGPGPGVNVSLQTDGGDAGLDTSGLPATISAFRLDKYLTTVGRFRQFVKAWNGGNGWAPANGAGKHSHLNGGMGLADAISSLPGGYEPGWAVSDDVNIAPTDANLQQCDAQFVTWTSEAGSNENLPMDCVTWYEAYAFCIWDGGFLPSEAEWEYAASGGNQQRTYPWGSTNPGTASQYAIYGCDFPTGSSSCQGAQNIAPVGQTAMGAGLWGQLDMAGEFWEWTLDWRVRSFQSKPDGTGVEGDPCNDCAFLTNNPTLSSGVYRVVRGGNFAQATTALYANNFSLLIGLQEIPGPTDGGPGGVSYYDDLDRPGDRGYNGFRCARAPQ